jgi:ATP-binding cassette, subfamily G (WHITE), member 2, PDR
MSPYELDDLSDLDSLTSSSSTDVGEPDEIQRVASIIGENDRRELQRLATALSRHPSLASRPEASRHPTGLDRIATLGENDSRLQPDSKDFDIARWLKRVMHDMRAEGLAVKQSGIAYENLNVSGSAPALQLQDTVGSLLTAPLRLGETFSFGQKEHKKILQNFNGVLNSGELLIVLGRPGSGCSTLLKTICGELHGLTVDEKSTISYNGIPQKTMMEEFRGEAPYNQEVCHFLGQKPDCMR